MLLPPSPDLLRRVRASRVYNVATKTPLDIAPLLTAQTNRPVLLKREDTQPVHSFKLRGAYERMAALPPAELAQGVIAASAGNHAQGVALAAKNLGVPATIVVPVTTPAIKRDAIRRLGAEVLLHGDTFDEAQTHARHLAQTTGKPFVPPFDDLDVIVGQATVALEIHDQAPPDLEALFVPVGGGGLLAGCSLVLNQLRPNVKIVGVEPEDSDAMAQALAAGAPVTLPAVGLFADGCAVRRVGDLTHALAQRHQATVITVTTDEICAAIQDIFQDRRAIVEPSGALAWAGMKKWAAQFPGPTPLAAVLSGANLNFDRLHYVTERARLGAQTEALFAVQIPERPGTFRQLCRLLGAHALTEFNYRLGDPERALVFAGIAVTGPEDRGNLKSLLQDNGYPVTDLTNDEVAKNHVRHMVGGRAPQANNERVFRVDFPERPRALADFLERLDARWNVSLFHYRNHGSDRGRALVGFQIPSPTTCDFETFLQTLPNPTTEVTHSPAVALFLAHHHPL